MTDTTPGRADHATPGQALRFAFGTLTVLPVRCTRWDRAAARGGMAAAPLAGLVVGGCAGGLGWLFLLLGASPALAAVAAVAVPAVLTRGLHLDGLADVADGLGSGKPAQDALRIMKQSDIGPFGVITLLLTLLGQVAALASLYDASPSRGALAATVAGVTARCALTLACRAGVPAARPGGLGAAVAEALRARWALAVTALVLALAGAALSWHGVVAVLLALTGSELLLHHCVRRFGGVTGDVFGSLAETAATTALVTLTLG
ncbi:adenosylcobinamide-GDP ribazoletransferase [Streptomyces sp. UNOC14_S4]|uniref:adenosylcobinamide-GDP ribazoletransferase n=1 Tax=Streptomyces sp. UNOC14_S4 TaxID=2872340 RepID=UPI001E326FDD|nr:adenosylcobinamide-GDP ribazoletransferase [Streptomyces sp. UNOC14_S4]MCC3770501.1 adenosylcobinamide-GDP ribazoletransferase [Streptomyces sp. UNOC14_S4]